MVTAVRLRRRAGTVRWLLAADHLRVLRAVCQSGVDLCRPALPRSERLGHGVRGHDWRQLGDARRGREELHQDALAASAGLRPVPAVQRQQEAAERRLLKHRLQLYDSTMSRLHFDIFL